MKMFAILFCLYALPAFSDVEYHMETPYGTQTVKLKKFLTSYNNIAKAGVLSKKAKLVTRYGKVTVKRGCTFFAEWKDEPDLIRIRCGMTGPGINLDLTIDGKKFFYKRVPEGINLDAKTFHVTAINSFQPNPRKYGPIFTKVSPYGTYNVYPRDIHADGSLASGEATCQSIANGFCTDDYLVQDKKIRAAWVWFYPNGSIAALQLAQSVELKTVSGKLKKYGKWMGVDFDENGLALD